MDKLIDDGKNVVFILNNDVENLTLERSKENAQIDVKEALQKQSEQLGTKEARMTFYGPYTKIGYENTKYLKTVTIGIFSSPNYPSLNGYYLADLYEFFIDRIVPIEADFQVKGLSNQNLTNMGFLTPLVTTALGYDFETLPSGDPDYKICRVKTHVLIITHNTLGQSVGPYYYPATAQNPGLFEFEYYWIIW